MLRRLAPVLILAVLGLSACAAPEPLADLPTALAARQRDLPADLAQRPLTVEDAIRLAVAHNLDLRIKAMEGELAAGKATLSRYALLPQMTVGATTTFRSRVRETISRDTATQADATSYSTSEDRQSSIADLALSWNLVDLGLAALRSGEEADRVLIAEEKRRRALHVLAQDVRTAYWRSVVNEIAERRYRVLEQRLHDAIDRARAAEMAQLGDPLQLLNQQRAILDSLRQIAEMQRQCATARSELAGLMGVGSAAGFQLAELPEDGALPVAPPGADIDGLEREALANRPEVQIDETQFRIDVAEVRAEMLKTIPGIGPFLGGHYDSNSFVRHHAWADAGLRVAGSLNDLITAPRRIDNARAVAELTRARRLATAMAVMTQVNVADTLYRHAHREYTLTERMAEVDGRIRRLSGDARKSGSGSAIEEMRATAASALSSLRRLLIYSDLEAARAKLDAALGRDPLAPAAPPPPPVTADAPPPEPAGRTLAKPEAAAAPPPQPATETPPEQTAVPVPGGGPLVYLASFRTAASASRGFEHLRRKAASLTGEPVLRAIDLPGRGQYVRLFARASDAGHAVRICGELGAASAECGVKGRE